MFSSKDDKKDNEVVMLEQQRTNEDYPEKNVPAIAKVDYSGAYEVCLHLDLDQGQFLLTPSRKPTLGKLPS
jgi:hypothetical protein